MHAELHLPIFKQGDDLGHFLKTLDNEAALNEYANTLDAAAAQLRAVAKGLGKAKVDINADTHYIGLEGPDDILQPLIDQDLLEKSMFEDEDEDEDEEEEDDDAGI